MKTTVLLVFLLSLSSASATWGQDESEAALSDESVTTVVQPDGEAEAAGDLFAVCGRFVRMLSSRSCTRMALLFFAFEWELLARHGMAPEVSACVSCGLGRAE